MNSQCPSCQEDLAGRYLGAISAQCPFCKVSLQLNVHPSEGGPLYGETLLYALPFGAGGALWLAGASAALVAAGSFLVAIAYGARVLFFVRHSAPADWPRWRISKGSQQTHASNGALGTQRESRIK